MACQACKKNFKPLQLIQNPCQNLVTLKLFRLGNFEYTVCPLTHESSSNGILGTSSTPDVLRRWLVSKEGANKLGMVYDEQCGRFIPEEPRQVLLTQDMVKTKSFAVSISAFVPETQDATAFKWYSLEEGRERSHPLPPYYISNPVEACENLWKFVAEGRQEYCDPILAKRHPIARRVFQEAERFSRASQVTLSLCLRPHPLVFPSHKVTYCHTDSLSI